MNREEIIRLATQAGFDDFFARDLALERFAVLVAAAEREACARLAEDDRNFDSTECGTDVANDIASAIRTSVL